MELQSFAVRRRTPLALTVFALLVFLAQSVGAGEREDIAIEVECVGGCRADRRDGQSDRCEFARHGSPWIE